MEQSTTHELSIARSVLNPIAPIGVGTPEVESLVSYFCRLAISHCISAGELGRKVARAMEWTISKEWKWTDVNLSGMSDKTQEWATALSKLTSVDTLDSLTLLTWRDVISEHSRLVTSAQWCPHCLADDLSTGATPYFRLCWDIGTVTACFKHKSRLVHACPDCRRLNTRHKSVFVVPGWCASCGAFLGDGDSDPATSAELWLAAQVAAMLAAQSNLPSRPSLDMLLDGIRKLVQRLDGGESARFARRIGLPKTTVHYWLKKGVTPALPALLRIASQTGLALPKLLTGDLVDWSPSSVEIHVLSSIFPDTKKRAPRQLRDWEQIRAKLATSSESSDVISVAQAARDLNVDSRLLYIHANKEARLLAERWNQHRQLCNEKTRKNTSELIERIYPEIVATGKAVNLREIIARSQIEDTGKCRYVFQLLQEMREKNNAS